MGLEEYDAKRDFDKTPEPSGGTPGEGRPIFVVQKHDASRLHYDFRLQVGDVLASWAVPKGPSLDPAQKRLAVHVEDHPLDYAGFEGVIPRGEYGGGTVMVWDRGTYEPRNGDPAEAIDGGEIKVELHGEKLTGGFVLVHMKGRDGKDGRENWLLIKERDEHVREDGDVLAEKPDSALSGRSMAEIEADGEESGDESAGEDEDADPSSVPGARAAPAPERIDPELARLTSTPPEGEGWLHEIKLDGYRTLIHVSDGRARFYTRSGAEWTDRFSALVADAAALPVGEAWLDGEVVVVRSDGSTSFGALQAELARGRDADLRCFAFDLLYLDGYDLRDAPLIERKRLLARVLGAGRGRISYLDHVRGQGPGFLEAACVHALEGSISKRVDAPYRAGRGGDWRKHKCRTREEFAVIGFTEPSSGGAGLGALALASASPSGALAYAGRVGTGWDDEESRKLRTTLEEREAAEPVVEVPDAEARGVRWVRPELTVDVEFAEWTDAGRLRHPAYVGMHGAAPVGAGPSSDPPGGSGADASGESDDAEARVAGVRLTHPDRVLFAEQGITKRQLAEYYEQVAEHVLPHLRGRPLVLVRCPQGADGSCFYQKDVSQGFPSSVGRLEVSHEEGPVRYALVDDLEGLLALVQLGVLEIHTWGAPAADIERPDRLTFDLDPGPDVAWSAVVDAALDVRARLEVLGLDAFAKTTGGKGLHVVTPIAPDRGWGEARDLARAVVEAIAAEKPERYTTNPRKERRGGKVFLDYIRNTRGATAVAAYSTRAKPGATVSFPVRWDEIEAGVRSDGYTVRNTPYRLRALGTDPWVGYEDARVTVTDAMLREAGVGV
ncbi:MAG: DNA ligase D [Anaerosomatales bacterium]|nr:DNA ligase D [Anaerosomatales bacterium]